MILYDEEIDDDEYIEKVMEKIEIELYKQAKENEMKKTTAKQLSPAPLEVTMKFSSQKAKEDFAKLFGVSMEQMKSNELVITTVGEFMEGQGYDCDDLEECSQCSPAKTPKKNPRKIKPKGK